MVRFNENNIAHKPDSGTENTLDKSNSIDEKNEKDTEENIGRYAGVGSIDVAVAKKGERIEKDEQEKKIAESIKFNEDYFNKEASVFKKKIIEDLGIEDSFDKKIDLINEKIDFVNKVIEKTKDGIINDKEGYFEDGFIDKIFDGDGNLIEEVNKDSTVRGTRNSFKILYEKINILNDIKSELEFSKEDQKQEESDIRKAA